MRRVRIPSRHAFTLIELLVVIAIIAVLIGLLLPAVQKVRAAAARSKCQNNLHNIGLAVQNYHSAFEKFPYAALDRQPNDPTATTSYYTGFIQIMPFLEQDAVARRWDPKQGRSSTVDTDGDGFTNAMLQKMTVPTFTCPSMTPPSGSLGGAEERAPCSYLFSAGTPDAQMYAYWSFYGLSAEPRWDGVIIPLKDATGVSPPPTNTAPTQMKTIIDGTSNTYLVGETDFMPRGVASTEMGGVWAYGYIGFTFGVTFHKFNTHTNTTTLYGAFRSEHPGGAHFAMTDGSVGFVRDTIDPDVYKGYSTRDGGEALPGN